MNTPNSGNVLKYILSFRLCVCERAVYIFSLLLNIFTIPYTFNLQFDKCMPPNVRHLHFNVYFYFRLFTPQSTKWRCNLINESCRPLAGETGNGTIIPVPNRVMEPTLTEQSQPIFTCQLCNLSCPFSYYGQKPPNTRAIV